MKKKMIMALLALGIMAAAVGCGKEKSGETKEKDTKTEASADKDKEGEDAPEAEEETTEIPTDKDGNVVAADVDDITKYVTLGEYKNIELQEEKTEITDADVEEYVNQQLVYQPEEIKEDRPVQENDTVNIDYTGYMDGEEFEGGKATDSDLLIGSGQFIEGFESGLIGKKKGEEVTLDLNFPDPYTKNEELSGKAVQFKVKINKISAAPELTDEWVAANSEQKTVAEYKQQIKDMLQDSAEMDYQNRLKSDLFQKVVESSEIKEYPQDLMETTKKSMNDRILKTYAEPSGMTLEQYWSANNITEEDADKAVEQMAQDSLKQSLIVQAILNAEGITLSKEAYQEELETFAKEYNFENAEALMSAYNDEELIRSNVLWNKSCQVLKDTAKVTDVAPSQGETEGEAE